MKKLRLKTYKGKMVVLLLGLSVLVFSCKKNDDTVTPPPAATIAGVTGPTGLTSGPKNSVITITGTNFITDLSKIQVKVNGKVCIVLSATATSITAQIPPACGTGVVELLLDGALFTGPVFTFEYTYTLSSVTNGQIGYLDGPVATAKLEDIVGICIDGSDNVFTAQYNNPRVRKIGADGMVSTMAGDGTLGAVNGNGTAAKLGQADFVSSDAAGNIYVAETNNGTATNYIRKIDVNKNVTNFAIVPAGTSIQGIKVMPNGIIYVQGFDRIGKVTTAGVFSWLAVSAVGTGEVDGPVGTARFSLYGGIEVSADEKKIYVTDFYNGTNSGNKVKLFDITANTIMTIAGKTGLSTGDGDALNVGFKLLTCTLLDNKGGLYIADGFNDKIKYLKNGMISTFIGSAGGGDTDGDISIGKINYPHGLVWDSKGNLFISNASAKLKKLTID